MTEVHVTGRDCKSRQEAKEWGRVALPFYNNPLLKELGSH
jgi:hypothetical protein